jgi:hypothetical protein
MAFLLGRKLFRGCFWVQNLARGTDRERKNPSKNSSKETPARGVDMPEEYRRPHTHERLQTVGRMRRAWKAHFPPRAMPGSGRRPQQRSPQSIRGWSSLAKVAGNLDLRVKPGDPEGQSASPCVTYAAPAAIAMVTHALSRSRVGRQS